MMRKQVQYLIPAALIVNSQHKILMIKKSSARTPICIKKWEFPGGTTKFGETLEAALKRKIKEYVGLDILIKKIIPYVHSNVTSGQIKEENMDMQFYVVGAVCELIDEKQLIKRNKSRIEKVRWFSYEEIMRLPDSEIVPGDKEIIKASRI